MPTLEFVQIDVFTDRAFSGNQLAVFPDGRGLSTHQMQTLAREMNFSETTFVLPAEEAGNAARVRIFTTTKEMPMAGHPTIGTALVLMQRGLLKNNRAVFELNIGPTTIEIDHNTGGSLPLVWMTQGLPHFGDIRTDRETVAASLDLSVADLMDDLPIQVVSTGVPYLLVPLNNLAALRRARCNQGALSSLFVGANPLCLYLFAAIPGGFRARMFDPSPNEIPEDPATGSAAGPLAAYTAHWRSRTGQRLVIEQGIEMGRASLIFVIAEHNGDAFTRIMVGGTGVIVGHGEVYWE